MTFFLPGAVVFRIPAVHACVACGSPAAHLLRQELFSGSFPARVALMAAPFPVLVLAAFAASYWFSLAVRTEQP